MSDKSYEIRGSTLHAYAPLDKSTVLAIAESLIASDFYRRDALTDPKGCAAFLRAKLHDRPYEVFCVVHLDSRHRVLAFEELFRGTIDGASIHPRELVRSVLKHNAQAVVLSHNRAEIRSRPRPTSPLRAGSATRLPSSMCGYWTTSSWAAPTSSASPSAGSSDPPTGSTLRRRPVLPQKQYGRSTCA